MDRGARQDDRLRAGATLTTVRRTMLRGPVSAGATRPSLRAAPDGTDDRAPAPGPRGRARGGAGTMARWTRATRAPSSGSARRRSRAVPVGSAESQRANRRWWDADADDYHAEHGAFLGDVDFVWCPENLREADVAPARRRRRTPRPGGRLRIGAVRALARDPGRRRRSRSICRAGCCARLRRSPTATGRRVPLVQAGRQRAALRRRQLRPGLLGVRRGARSWRTPRGRCARWPGCCGRAAAGCSR